MRYAIISDVHSNIEALTSFFEEADKTGVDKTVCLGDVVGYNANPNECTALLRERGALVIMGNHDSRAAGLEEPTDFNLMAQEAIYWTRERLTEENRNYLKGLPRNLVVDNKFLAFHGFIDSTDNYILGARDALYNFELLKGYRKISLGFFGHTHVAIGYLHVEGKVELCVEDRVILKKGIKYLLNPGGVGQPRDRDPRAAFIVYDTKTNEVQFKRVEYDIQTTVKKILDAGLPPRLAERLKLGW